MRDDLLVTLKDGKLELLFWESPINKQKSIHISDIMFSVDMQVAGILVFKSVIGTVNFLRFKWLTDLINFESSASY